MNYMSFGLVSFSSFFKFTLFYVEVLMFSFKWIKRYQENVVQKTHL